MSAAWGSTDNPKYYGDHHAKWMIRIWFLLTIAGLLFIDFGGHI